jgi:membrane-bound lytic murein transglycosylase D
MGIRKLYLLIAGLIALTLASVGCGTAQRPAPLLPAKQASAPALTANTQAQPQPAAETKPATPSTSEAPKEVPQPDPVAELIAQVEKEYQTGLDNYKAGHTEAAQANFHHAIDLMLKNPLGVESDERLRQEFTRLTFNLDDLALAPTPQADAAPAEQTTEAAPIDETNEITVPVDPNIKAKAAAEVKATPSSPAADAIRK